MKNFALFICIIICSLNLKAQFVTITDSNFLTFLQENYPSCVNSNQLNINCASNQVDTAMFLMNLSLTNISGIEYFTNLKFLQCSNNNLTNISSLPPNIKTFLCHENQLTTLPNLPINLEILNCSANQLIELPELPNSITNLNCRRNQLSNLPTLPNNLFSFDCSQNYLTVIPELPNGLAYFLCQLNQLVSLPILPNSLLSLNCENNELYELPLLPNNITFLNCMYNQISCLTTLPDFLTSVYVGYNPLTCIPNEPNGIDLGFPICSDGDLINNPNGCSISFGLMGTVFLDTNESCIFQNQKNILKNVPLNLYDVNNDLVRQTQTSINGTYHFAENSGTFTAKLDSLSLIDSPIEVSCDELVYTVNLNVIDSLFKNLDFLIDCKPGFDIGTKSILTNGLVFPGLTHEVKIIAGDLSQFYNMKCASGITGQVQISVLGPVSYQGNTTNTLIPLVNGNTYTYDIADFGTLNMFESFGLIFQTDTTAQVGDQICVNVTVTPELGDNNPNNNVYEFCYDVVNSYDPNMKEVFPINVDPGYEDYFTYTIHFQNTGNAPAMNIRLMDTLDSNLELETFQILNYSHYQTSNVRNNILTFHFPNIQLPDSTSNPEGSKGYVQYRIKPKANLPVGTEIKNTAYIYFDYNEPIVTNTTVNKYVIFENSLMENDESNIKIYPNPFSTSTTIKFESKLQNATINVYSIYGQKVREITNFSGDKFIFQKENLPSGTYFLEVKHANFNKKEKLIIGE